MADSFGPPSISNWAISLADYEKYGCPVCKTGEKKIITIIQTKGATAVTCCECDTSYIILADGVEVSPIRPGGKEVRLQPHPLNI